MTTLIIHGDPSGDVLRRVERIVGESRLFKQGTDTELYARYLRREDCQQAIERIRELAVRCALKVE